MSEATNTDLQKTSTDSKKKKECLDVKQVHSANSWEKVELGDDDRKKKFLRLMGAAKTQHQGRFVIGDQDKSHGRTMNDTDTMTSDLEKQFTDGLDHKFAAGPRAHIGLGFHSSDSKEKGSAEKCEGKEEAKEEVKLPSVARTEEKGRQESKSDIAPKHKLEESSNSTDPDKPQIKMMKFVKSSS